MIMMVVTIMCRHCRPQWRRKI